MGFGAFGIGSSIRIGAIARKFGNAWWVKHPGILTMGMAPHPIVFDAKMKKIAQELGRRYTPHQKAGRRMVWSVRNTIKKEQTHAGQDWEPLKASTLERRARMGYSGTKALVRSGKLKRSIQYEVIGVERGGIARKFSRTAGHVTVTRISPEKARRSSKSIPARVHQGRGLGTYTMTGEKHRSKIWARPYLGISKDDRMKIQEYFQLEINKILKENSVKGVVR